MLVSASAIAGASFLAVIAAGGSYALWNGAADITGTTVSAGSTGLTVNDASSYPLGGVPWSSLLPGDIVSQEVTVKNTGTVPGTVTASTAGSFTPLVVHVKKGACGATITGTASTVSPTDIGVFAGGEGSIVCLQVTLPATVANSAQGTSQSFLVTFTLTAGS